METIGRVGVLHAYALALKKRNPYGIRDVTNPTALGLGVKHQGPR